MIWVRKGIVYILSLFLLVSLVGVAVSTSANQTLGKPKKVETYLAQSKLYDHFVAYAAGQAKQSSGDSDQSGSVSLNDAAVQTDAQTAFSSQLIQQSINTFLDSNYAWLEGKTATPNFKIDLSSQKQTFAQLVGQRVKTYTAGLPVCASPEAAAQQTGDPLAATCRPAEITPEAAGAQVTQRLSTTGDFLSNPVVTANSVNPKGNQQGRPYYQKLSRLPKLYRVALKLPFIFSALALLSVLGIVFISPVRRKGVRRVGIILLISGIILVAMKFIADFLVKKMEHRVFSSASVGQLQQSLTDFAHRVESAMVKTDLLFGIAFLVLALIIFGILMRTRKKDKKPKVPAAPDSEPTGEQAPLIISRKRFGKRTPSDSIMPLGAKPPAPEPQTPAGPAPVAGKPPAEPAKPVPAPLKPKQRRRLIQ